MADNPQTKTEKLIKYGNEKFGLNETTLRGVLDNASTGENLDNELTTQETKLGELETEINSLDDDEFMNAILYSLPYTKDVRIDPEKCNIVGQVRQHILYDKSNFKGNLILPEGIESIDTSAFNRTGFSGTLKLPNSLTYVSSSVFQASQFEHIIFGSGLNTLSTNMFSTCTKLLDLSIPSSITSISNYAFYNCTALKSVVYEGQAPNISSMTYMNSNAIRLYDFRNCTSVPTLPNTNSLGHATGCQIVIPDALYDEWTTATNWSSLTDVMFVKASEYVE